jgi:hypothetical protein
MVAGSNVAPTQPDYPALGTTTPLEQPPKAVPPTWPDAAPLAPAPAPAPPPAAAPPEHKRTMMGLAPAAFAPPAPPQPAAVPANAPEPPQPSFAPVGIKRTMMGLAPPSIPQPPAAQPQYAAQRPIRTMVGIAPAAPEAPSPPASVEAPRSAALPSQHKTKMGIAHPGIAPLHPGVAKPAPASAPHAPPSASGAELREDDLAVLPGHGRRTSSRAAMIVLAVLSIAVVLLGLAIVIALWFKRSPDLDARAGVDASGRETLALTCAEPCPWARVSMGSASAEFRGGKAELPLSSPLAVGDNEIALELEESGGSRRSIELNVPVAYRLKTDFANLASDPPRVSVLVEAEPETAVVVDGQAVALDAAGKGSHQIDVSRELTGSSARVVPLEKKVPYNVTRSKSEPERGELVLRIGIVPLEVEAPGESIVIDSANFTLAGRTQTGGSVTVGGRPITVDPSGRFAQLMNVSSVGETTIAVRATADEHAPRLFPIRVRRVQSLQAEAARFGARATSGYGAIASDIAGKRGWAVAFEGEVVEARTENHTSIVLLDVKSGCSRAPCLARLVHGARTGFKRGDAIAAYGHVTGPVDGPRSGVKIPEIRADFILPSSGAPR